MKINNFIPTIVERGIRKAKRYIKVRSSQMAYYKSKAHRSYRRKMNMHLYKIACGVIDPEEYDDSPGGCSCTTWDIW